MFYLLLFLDLEFQKQKFQVVPCFIALRFMVLHSVEFVFYKLKAGPYTSKKILTCFIVGGLELNPQYLQDVPAIDLGVSF